MVVDHNNRSDERKLKSSTHGEVQGALEDLGNCSPSSDFKICITHSLKCSFLWSHILRVRETCLQSAVDCLEKKVCLIFLKLEAWCTNLCTGGVRPALTGGVRLPHPNWGLGWLANLLRPVPPAHLAPIRVEESNWGHCWSGEGLQNVGQLALPALNQLASRRVRHSDRSFWLFWSLGVYVYRLDNKH